MRTLNVISYSIPINFKQGEAYDDRSKNGGWFQIISGKLYTGVSAS